MRFPSYQQSSAKMNGGRLSAYSSAYSLPDPVGYNSTPQSNNLNREFKRRTAAGPRMMRLRGLSTGSSGMDGLLGEIGKFNSLYVPPFLQDLMRRSVYPRLALLILKASLSQRQYVVEGDDPVAEKFHQAWIDRLLPSIMRKASNAIWFGWQPFVLDWERTDGFWTPSKVHDLDPFTTTALRDIDTGHYVGLQTEDGEYGPTRSMWMTWDEEGGDPYGYPQSYTCYPYWWAASVAMVWMMRYHERSVDPVRLAFARNLSVPTGNLASDGSPEQVDLTQIIAQAMSDASNGDSVAVPLGVDDDGKPVDLVRIDTLDLPDRSDVWLKLAQKLEESQFIASLCLPGIGLSSGTAVSFADGRTTQQTQLSILEYASDMPLRSLNEQVIPEVHAMAGFPGRPPIVKGKAFKREQQETLRSVLTASLTERVPEIQNGQQTGKVVRLVDMIRPEWLLRSLDIASYEQEEAARDSRDISSVDGGMGGRPVEPLSDRADDRRAGLDR